MNIFVSIFYNFMRLSEVFFRFVFENEKYSYICTRLQQGIVYFCRRKEYSV